MMRIYLAWPPSCRRGTHLARRPARAAVEKGAVGTGVLKFVYWQTSAFFLGLSLTSVHIDSAEPAVMTMKRKAREALLGVAARP